MAFNFPDGAENGDLHTASNGVVYRYNGNRWVIDSAGNNASLDARFLNTKGEGVISGSSQLPSGVVSGSSQVTSILPTGTISGSSQITNVITQNYVSQSAAAAGFGSGGGSSRSDATISGSFLGEVSSSNYLQNVKDTISGSFSLSRLPAGTISGSDQLPSGVISGSDQLPNGVISGSAQVTSILPSGTISGSAQITSVITDSYISSSAASSGFGSGGGSNRSDATISGSFRGELSSSVYLQQVKDTISGSFSVSRLPAGTISGSRQLPSGIISGSLQLPSGLISGSTQISESGFVSSSTTNIIEVMTSASYATITPVSGTLYIIQG